MRTSRGDDQVRASLACLSKARRTAHTHHIAQRFRLRGYAHLCLVPCMFPYCAIIGTVDLMQSCPAIVSFVNVLKSVPGHFTARIYHDAPQPPPTFRMRAGYDGQVHLRIHPQRTRLPDVEPTVDGGALRGYVRKNMPGVTHCSSRRKCCAA